MTHRLYLLGALRIYLRGKELESTHGEHGSDALSEGAMKTYQECVREYDDSIPHKTDVYMLGFLDAITFVFDKPRAQVIKDVEAYRSERDCEEDETSVAFPLARRPRDDREPLLMSE